MENTVLVYTDGASRGNPGPAGLGVSICSPAGEEIAGIKEYLGVATNNQAEYRALERALQELSRRGIKQACFYADSELLVKQVNGLYKIKNSQLKIILDRIRNAGRGIDWKIEHVFREKNKRADQLANQAIDEKDSLPPAPTPQAEIDPSQMLFFSEAAPPAFSPQISAGGVIYKKEGGQYKICLVAKKGGKTWAFPKGRVDLGESLEETAKREIQEETGYRVEVKTKIAEINYYFYWKENNTVYHKRVHFFLMNLLCDAPGPRDSEVDDVQWFVLGDAKRKLTYLNEKNVLDKAIGLLR